MDAIKYVKLIELFLIAGIDIEKIDENNLEKNEPEILFLNSKVDNANALLDVYIITKIYSSYFHWDMK